MLGRRYDGHLWIVDGRATWEYESGELLTFDQSGVAQFPGLVLSVWCGLVSGFLEVGMIVLRKWTFDPKQLYEMSRHFIWLIPLANLCLFLALRALLKPLLLVWPRQVNWLALASYAR